jgi:NAD(P)-dependent dehydrogenase (short-subunit alcohol dehydrogenase family)
VQALRGQGITVSVLEPGFVDTPLVKDVPGDHSMFIQPEDVAQAALLPFALRSAAPVEIVLRLVRRAQ